MVSLYNIMCPNLMAEQPGVVELGLVGENVAVRIRGGEVSLADVPADQRRQDRVPDRRVFQGFGGDRFRTALTRACTAAGVPAFSPPDLRHRRISLLHLGGVPWVWGPALDAELRRRATQATAQKS